MPSKLWDEITYPLPNFDGCTLEVWEWVSNFIPHIIMDVITYPCWDYTMLVKGVPHVMRLMCDLTLKKSSTAIVLKEYDHTVMFDNTPKDLSISLSTHNMMTSSNGNIFLVTGPLCGEFTGPR